MKAPAIAGHLPLPVTVVLRYGKKPTITIPAPDAQQPGRQSLCDPARELPVVGGREREHRGAEHHESAYVHRVAVRTVDRSELALRIADLVVAVPREAECGREHCVVPSRSSGMHGPVRAAAASALRTIIAALDWGAKMPKHQEAFTLPVSVDRARALCDSARGELSREDWLELAWGTLRATFKEPAFSLSPERLLRHPVTVDVTLTASGNAVHCELSAHNAGWGPLQTQGIRSVARAFRERVEHLATPPAGASGTSPVARMAPARVEPASGPQAADAPVADAPATSSTTAHSVFVSYRRHDSDYVTDQICERLAAVFGTESVFKDVDSIPPGVNFQRFLNQAVQSCDVMLAVIGRDWLGDAEGDASRLSDPADFVRIELEAAMERAIPIIPVLVSDAGMPAAADLPPSLSDFPYYQSVRIRRAPDFTADVERLCDALHRYLA